MPAKKAAPTNGDSALAVKVEALELRVDALESGRPGRKAKPMVALRQQGVCALDPERDSATCPDASIFRYQMGCHGTMCRGKQHDAYMRRKNKKTTTTAKPVKKAAAKKAPAKKAPAKRASVDIQAANAKSAAKRPVKKVVAKKQVVSA